MNRLTADSKVAAKHLIEAHSSYIDLGIGSKEGRSVLSKPFVRCAAHSTFTDCHGGGLNAYSIWGRVYTSVGAPSRD